MQEDDAGRYKDHHAVNEATVCYPLEWKCIGTSRATGTNCGGQTVIWPYDTPATPENLMLSMMELQACLASKF